MSPIDAGAPSPRRPSLGQYISLAAAWLCYAGALASLGCLFWWWGPLGYHHPIIASLIATTAFFVSTGWVLQVIGRTDLPNLEFGREDGDPPGAGRLSGL
jgi:hypothetical protein